MTCTVGGRGYVRIKTSSPLQRSIVTESSCIMCVCVLPIQTDTHFPCVVSSFKHGRYTRAQDNTQADLNVSITRSGDKRERVSVCERESGLGWEDKKPNKHENLRI